MYFNYKYNKNISVLKIYVQKTKIACKVKEMWITEKKTQHLKLLFTLLSIFQLQNGEPVTRYHSVSLHHYRSQPFTHL